MSTVKFYTEKNVPEWAVGYIVNGDEAPNLDTEMINEWLSIHAKDGYFPASVGEESYFSWNPQFGLACTCVDLDFVKH